uniref:NADH-ubiquinone oxidoreductase chain 6 n=1 Tax=Operophtera brumata TaxID=104452 RepID=A0A0K0M9E1_OPEBR|nr:NADH dehydrogenase subunit 6 [Operophtera brumata]AJW60231.1 NADH dehydrogenase subunit 6 [Operophtera brumata]
MMKIFISTMMILISMFMMFLSHPLSMGLMILTQTLLMCLLSGMLIKTYWFSYILFLTFLGGLLVLFIYVSSIASNEMFSMINNNMKMFFIFTFMFFIMMQFMYFNNLNWMNLSNNLADNNNFFDMYFFNNENKININKLYNSHNFMLMMMMVIYLFITLIAVVKITNIFYGPLRSS